MRQLALTLMLCVTAQALFSQQDSLLKKFRYRVDHYRAIGFNLNSAGQYNRLTNVNDENRNSGFNSSIGASYNSIKSTDKMLFTSSFGIGSSLNLGKTNTISSDYKTTSYALIPSISVLNKWFSKNMFTELGVDASANIYSNKNTNNSGSPDPYNNNKEQYYAAAIHLGIGKGRLENVTDMQNALWLYKELQAEKSITGNLSAGELLDLARSITSGNNTRVLDARKRTKFILETVDGYLQQKGLVNKTDIRYFSSLNDILFFAFNNQRLAGTEKFIRITPGISSSNLKYEQGYVAQKIENHYLNKSVVLTAGLNKYIPTNLQHQNNYGVALKVYYLKGDYKEKSVYDDTLVYQSNIKPAIKRATVAAFFQHAIYPNTRTIFSIDLNSETGYQDIADEKNFYGELYLSGNLSYFVSYRTRFTCSIGARYQKNTYNTFQNIRPIPDALQLNVNAGVEINL